MSSRRKVAVVFASAVIIVVAAVGVRVLPVFTGPALPAGATRLHIATEPPNADLGCMAALLEPVRVSVAGDELILVNIGSGEPVRVVWPAGFAAWRVDGRAVVADPWGNVVGREGGVLDSLSGGTPVDVFHICPFGIVTER